MWDENLELDMNIILHYMVDCRSKLELFELGDEAFISIVFHSLTGSTFRD